MTMTSAPVELPATRNSYILPTADQHDVHSPGWIPILSSGTTRSGLQREPESEKELSPYNTSSFSPISSTVSGSLTQKSLLKHKPSKSSEAPVPTTSEKEYSHAKPPPVPSRSDNPNTIELAATRPPSRHFERRLTAQASEEGQESITDTDGTSDSVRAASVGTGSLLGIQVYALPLRAPSTEGATGPSYPLSASSSIRSSQKVVGPAVPTSKYNRKPLPPSSRVHSAAPSIAQTPGQSPKLGPVPDVPQAGVPESDWQRPALPPRVDSMPSARQVNSILQATKSTSSQLRKRALHSHPSNVSLKSRPNSPSDTDSMPLPTSGSLSRPSSSHRAQKGADARLTVRTSIHDLQLPSPAPTTPLPELPPHARPSRNNTTASSVRSQEPPQITHTGSELCSRLEPPPEAHLSSTNPSTLVAPTAGPSPIAVPGLSHISAASKAVQPDYLQQPRMVAARGDSTRAGLSSFMTSTSTLIFRRFDDVHVQLLLHLQDEISQLEKELQTIESANATHGDREVKKMKTLRELRGVVGEYDAMLSSWGQMKTKKATTATTEDLKQWLQNSGSSRGTGLHDGSQQDLKWLAQSQEKGDLSVYDLAPGETKPEGRQAPSAKGTGFGQVMHGMFGSCGGRRKG